ncbi:MAG: PfkB family carbohydrate kinase [Burkholderiales bacterium]
MTAKSIRILCIGHTSLDRVFRVPSWPAGSAKIKAQSYRETGGGMAANAAAAIAQLGGNAEFWGPAGDDRIADVMAAELRRLGVDVSGLQRIAGCESSHSAILVDDRGERLIIGMRGQALQSNGDWLPIDRVEFASVVLADVRWPAGARRVMIAAREWGVPTILDADVAEPGTLRALVGLADYAIFSESGLDAFAGTSESPSLARAFEAGATIAIVTRGAKGSDWVANRAPNVVHHLPAHPIDIVVDTTGAGDVFHGAFALALAEAQPLERAMRFATIAASLKCARDGARSVPNRSMVNAILDPD